MALQWIFVERRFRRLVANLDLKPEQETDGHAKVRGVAGSLKRAYWPEEDTTPHHFLVGSWGKLTAIRPPTDVDMMFVLPSEVYNRFNGRTGNVQSQLLQEVKAALTKTYSQTELRGDGQVVIVRFNSIDIEVVPAFSLQGGGYYICDTNDGGRWKNVDSDVELITYNQQNDALCQNPRKLARILKRWKKYRDVPIKGFHIERLVLECLEQSSYGKHNEFWFDWLVRDVLAHMISRADGGFYVAGKFQEWISFGDAWLPKARAAYEIALKACDYERANMNLSAGSEWQKLFGDYVPWEVT